MFQRLKSRRYAVTLIILTVAFVICWIAWMRFFYVALAHPSPSRYVEYITHDGARDPFRQSCAGPSFSEADRIWRFCEYDDAVAGQRAPQWGLVRFDLDVGEAAMLWPLPEPPQSQVLAVSENAAGDLAMAWGAPDLSTIYLVRAAGGVEDLGMPPEDAGTIAGLAWNGDALELVTADDVPAVHVYQDAAWQDADALAPPEGCGDAQVCTLQFAHRAEPGWRFIYAQAPAQVEDAAGAEVVLILQEADGSLSEVGRVGMDDLTSEQIAYDADGRLLRLGVLFDQSPGNVVNWSVDAAPLLLHGGAWEKVAAPPALDDASFYFSDYTIENGGLHWVPGVRYPQRGWQFDAWLTLRSTTEGVVLAELGGASGEPLTTDDAFAVQGASQTTLFPASDGGYWLLGPNGAYVKASPALDRADDLNLVERVRRAYDNFGRFSAVNGTFYRDQSLLKMLAIPMVLLSLPFGYLVVYFVHRMRRDTRAWIALLLQVSAVYLVLVTIFMWWFWEMTTSF